MTLALEQVTYLGPARVIRGTGNRVLLECSNEQSWALSALGHSYEAAPDDIVLAIGQDENWYVIGLIEGRGQTTITAPADLVFRAPRGTIQLLSAKGIRIRSPEVKVVSDRLELVARTFFETFGSARSWIKESLQVHAGRIRTIVDSCYRLSAGRIVERAENDVKIDGRKIHLG